MAGGKQTGHAVGCYPTAWPRSDLQQNRPKKPRFLVRETGQKRATRMVIRPLGSQARARKLAILGERRGGVLHLAQRRIKGPLVRADAVAIAKLAGGYLGQRAG